MPTRTGRPPKYHRSWLLTVSISSFDRLTLHYLQLCNSKAHEAFKAFKKQAMQVRRDDRLQKADQEILTLKEIAEKITQTMMVPGKYTLQC